MNLATIVKFQNSIISKYLMRNVVFSSFFIFVVIGLIIFGNQFVLVIKQNATAGLAITDLFPLIGLEMIKNIPLILSLSLFLAVIFTIMQLYKNSEAIAMNAVGIGDKNFMIFIQPVVLTVAAVALLLTLFITPWSQQQKHKIIQYNASTSKFSLIKAGEFQTFKNGEVVFYAAKINNELDNNQRQMSDVFIYAENDNRPITFLAKEATRYTDAATGNIYLRLKHGTSYHGFADNKNKCQQDLCYEIRNFEQYDWLVTDAEASRNFENYKQIEGKNTVDLFGNNRPNETAELQWRFSQPLGIVLLSILGVLLGKSSPRGGKNLGLLIGVLVFILYNNALLFSKSALEQGQLSAIIGLWWVHLLMLFIILIFYFLRHQKLAQTLDKIKPKFSLKGLLNAK